ncbi:hypothetical protein PHYC_00392 [Phycisphaerales bacterium]|nr:hypothetical protein PHYC_00392 [Phycisphaerales bacterium]
MPVDSPMTTLEFREIARMEEARQARGLAAVADEARPLAGGTMGRGVPGTWFNGAVGLGLNGAVSRAEIDELVEFYTSKGIEPRVEVCPFADESLIRGLADLGFVVRLFEMTFYRALDRQETVRPPQHTPHGIEIAALDAGDDGAVREYATVCVTGFAPPGETIRPEFIDAVAKTARHPRVTGVVARYEGRIVAAGGMEASGESAGLFGLSVLPEFRRRGIQQAMIAWRLNEASRRGSRIACIAGKPGEGTERNVRRMGFMLAYTKVHMVKPGEGLVPVVG